MSKYNRLFKEIAFFKRYLHGSNPLPVDKSQSLTWLQAFEKSGLDFFKATRNEDIPLCTQTQAARNASNSPELVERILKMETAMQEKGLHPFVHAMPQGTGVITEIARALFPLNKPFFHYLRPPIAPYTISRAEASQSIPKIPDRIQRGSLLSLSYAFTSGIQAGETAAYWGFNNHHGREVYFDILRSFKHLMETQTFCSEPDYKEEVEYKVTQLIRHFNRLAVGNFMMIGIPHDKLDLVYDSLAYNFPTGVDVRKVIANPAEYCAKRNYHMVTLPICSDLNPDSGIEIVNANNEEEVNAYCEGLSFKPMSDIPAFKKAFQGVTDPNFEKKQTEQREKLRLALKVYTKLIAEYKDSPKELVAQCSAIQLLDDGGQAPFDYPATLP